jgi:hypothetical protein
MHIEFRLGNHLEHREGDGKITLRWIIMEMYMRIRGGWNRFRVMSNVLLPKSSFYLNQCDTCVEY